MKGQMFIILAIVLVVILIGIRASLRATSYSENKIVWESSLNTKVFENLFDESLNIVDFVYPDLEGIPNYVKEFFDFELKKMRERGKNFEGIFIGVYPNSSSNQMNVTIVNFLGRRSLFSVNGQKIEVENNSTYSFLLSGIENLQVIYEDFNETIQVSSAKYSAFFDERLIAEDFYLRKAETKQVDLI